VLLLVSGKSENLSVDEIMCENIVILDRPWKIKYGVCALHVGYLRLQTHAQNM
jgi:hypothetical protein